MVQVRIDLNYWNKVTLQKVMKKYKLKTRSEAIELVLEQYLEKILLPELLLNQLDRLVKKRDLTEQDAVRIRNKIKRDFAPRHRLYMKKTDGRQR